ncbi:Spermidine synthase [Hoeflea phototrophica DFL-43]|jgi:predicted membrane-bound spermidine synthase|uniref:Spermidine synthase n=1 Tax=Hoeflea phototrophica (strain DSM 17068 / NCIMB 14078 / DFL-43) TaxID=411684 RepID=A9CVY3_HOEPD|nr:fused MFS/spermidine synthase [Hoeflea phototrophica]EDQ35440.2 Spermidine synthase [Hoeflea phototrophica DFL-43]
MTLSQARAPLALLVAIQAVVSGSSLVVEIVAGRMLAPYVGMSLYTWTSIIAVVLAGFSVGHWWGGHVAERTARQALVYTGWVLLAAAFATGCALVLLRFTGGPVLESVGHPVVSIVILTICVFFLPSVFAGVPAPVLTQIAVTTRADKSGRALGAMFAAGAVGAIAGTVLAGFLFIPWLGTAITLSIVTLVYLASAGLLFFMARPVQRPGLPVLVAGLAIAMSAVTLTRLSYCSLESRYFCIKVLDVSADPASPVRRLVLDHLSHGTSSREQPRLMFSEFTAMIDEIGRGRMGSEAFSTFFIGGGTYSVPRAWADRNTGPVTVAEIDPDVTAIAVRDFWVAASQFEILHEDARRALLTRSERRYDVIVGDAFGDIAVPSHLVTHEFFTLVRDRLSDDGVFLMNVVDFPERLEALGAITATLQSVFPSVEVWTAQQPPVAGEQRVFVLAAGSQPTPFSTIVTGASDPTRFAALADSFVQRLTERGGSIVLSDDYAPIDRLLAGSLWGG